MIAYGKRNCYTTEKKKKKDKSNKKHRPGGKTYPVPFRERGSHKEQGNKVETFLGLILPVILYCDFCFAFLIQKTDARPRGHYETLSAGNFHSGEFFFIFPTMEGENGLKRNTHT